MGDGAQCEPWVNLNLPAIGEVNKAFHCLHLEVDSRVVEDVRSKVDRAFSALWAASQNEIKECDEREARLSTLLTKTANALRGEPEPLKLHGWADLPERALKMKQERDEARSYGERLYQGALSRKVTCVYCGHEYPDGTPTSQDQQLTEHIKVCEKHPMRKLEQFKKLVHKYSMSGRFRTILYPGPNVESVLASNGLRTDEFSGFERCLTTKTTSALTRASAALGCKPSPPLPRSMRWSSTI